MLTLTHTSFNFSEKNPTSGDQKKTKKKTKKIEFICKKHGAQFYFLSYTN